MKQDSRRKLQRRRNDADEPFRTMVKTTGGKKRRADTTAGSKLNANFLWNSKKFDLPKTCANVSKWMDQSVKVACLKSSDIGHTAADGASNAIGSLVEYEALTREERSQDQDFATCFAHQN